MEQLDGNAIGGLLHDVFGAEMTAAVIECSHCGASGILAECEVYLGGPGAILRCRSCRGVLLAVVEIRSVRCVDSRGLTRLELVPRPARPV